MDNPGFFRQALKAGATHILLEKPGAPTVGELEAMALAPPRERGKGKLSFQNLSHFVEEAIVARDWLE